MYTKSYTILCVNPAARILVGTNRYPAAMATSYLEWF